MSSPMHRCPAADLREGHTALLGNSIGLENGYLLGKLK